MRQRFLISLLLAVTFFSCKKEVEAPTEYAIHSPSKVNTITFSIVNGKPIYKVNHGKQEAHIPAKFGCFVNDSDYPTNDLELIEVVEARMVDPCEQITGEMNNTGDTHNVLAMVGGYGHVKEGEASRWTSCVSV